MLSPAAPFAFFGALVFGIVVLFLVLSSNMMPLTKIIAVLAFLIEVWLIINAINGMVPVRHF